MAKSQMRFKRGDINVHYFKMPIGSWQSGGTLYFAAKPEVDNDNTDASAVIDKSFTDSSIVDSSHPSYDAAFATYELVFNPTDITGVTYQDGESRKSYSGEFQFKPNGGHPQSFPNTDDFIEVIIFADIKRGS